MLVAMQINGAEDANKIAQYSPKKIKYEKTLEELGV